MVVRVVAVVVLVSQSGRDGDREVMFVCIRTVSDERDGDGGVVWIMKTVEEVDERIQERRDVVWCK